MYIHRVQIRGKDDPNFADPAGSYGGSLVVRSLLWLAAATLALVVAWIFWAVLMVGGGLTTAVFCTLLVAPGAVFCLATRNARANRRARTREADASALTDDEKPSPLR